MIGRSRERGKSRKVNPDEVIGNWIAINQLLNNASVVMGQIGVLYYKDLKRGRNKLYRLIEDHTYERFHVLKIGDKYYGIAVIEERRVERGFVVHHDIGVQIVSATKSERRLFNEMVRRMKEDVEFALAKIGKEADEKIGECKIVVNGNVFHASWERKKRVKGGTLIDGVVIFHHVF